MNTFRVTVGRTIWLWLFALVGSSLWWASPAAAQVRYPERPAEGAFVADQAGMIDASDQAAIVAVCARLKAEKGIPLIVATISSMGDFGAPGWPIERYTMNLFAEWGIGRAQDSPGILLLVSKNDRKVRIEMGSGWSRNRDTAASSVVNGTIVPEFKAGRFSPGIRKGVEAIASRIGGLALGAGAGVSGAPSGTPLPGPVGGGGVSTSPSPAPSQRSAPAMPEPQPAMSVGSVLGPAACLIGGLVLLVFLIVLSRIGRSARRAMGGGGQGVVGFPGMNPGGAWSGYGPQGWGGGSGMGGFLPGLLLGNMLGHRGGSSSTPHSGSSSSDSGGFFGSGGGGFGGGGFGGGGGGGSFGGGFSGGGGATGSW